MGPRFGTSVHNLVRKTAQDRDRTNGPLVCSLRHLITDTTGGGGGGGGGFVELQVSHFKNFTYICEELRTFNNLFLTSTHNLCFGAQI